MLVHVAGPFLTGCYHSGIRGRIFSELGLPVIFLYITGPNKVGLYLIFLKYL